jgi:hypothetical protein
MLQRSMTPRVVLSSRRTCAVRTNVLTARPADESWKVVERAESLLKLLQGYVCRGGQRVYLGEVYDGEAITLLRVQEPSVLYCAMSERAAEGAEHSVRSYLLRPQRRQESEARDC